ncbi:hypothetical protein HY486_01345 [Candidatus Woesearchaeota archaeon]|nr:hypothetical protein [Candidatus Woesearchaeota archaeon]
MSIIKTGAALVVLGVGSYFGYNIAWKRGMEFQKQQCEKTYEQIQPKIKGIKEQLEKIKDMYEIAVKDSADLEQILQKHMESH